jgi:hypothetical protein
MWYLSSRETLTKIALIIIGIFIGVAAGELGMRTLFPTTGNYYAHRPFLQITFEPSPSVMPGLNGKSRYLVNSRGIRGEEFSNDQTYRILAVDISPTKKIE